MEFCKMNGAGNDFIIINNMNGEISEDKWPEIARVVCERHLSVGADGLMVVEKPDGDADYKMLFFNSDGSMGEMCGNGARCICRYGYEHGLAGETQTIETTAGIVTGERIDKLHYRVRLNDPSIVRLDIPIKINDTTYKCSYVELGQPGIPHVVVEIPGLEIYPHHKLFSLGRSLRCHPEFPKGANVNFYEILGDNLIYERTYERGVEDETLACGTGISSAGAVFHLLDKNLQKVSFLSRSGDILQVDISGECNILKQVQLTGPAVEVFRGTVHTD